MIEVNKNTLAGAFGALGKMICRTSPLALCKSIKVEAAEGKLRLSTCGLNEKVSFELETGGEEIFCCLVGFDEKQVHGKNPVFGFDVITKTKQPSVTAIDTNKRRGGTRSA